MLTRRSHYELAFEAYLTARQTPFVAVEDIRRSVPGRPGIKLFDYVVYGEHGRNFIVDVKGRKVAGGGGAGRGLDSWVTAADLDGLSEWRVVFGAGFQAAFVFAHWRSGIVADALSAPFCFAGRCYAFRILHLDDYQAARRVRSPKWRTFVLPRREFDRLARTPESEWGGPTSRPDNGFTRQLSLV